MSNNFLTSRNIRPFDGQDYESWSFRVKMLLKREKVLKIVTEQIPLARNRTQQWEDENGVAMEIITSNVSDKYLNIINRCDDAKSMWEAIERNFRQKSASKKTDLRNEIFGLKYVLNSGECLRDYTLRFRSLVTQMRQLNDGMTDQEYILQYLRSLPGEFLQLTTSFEMSDKNLDWDQVSASLMSFEERNLKASKTNGTTNLPNDSANLPNGSSSVVNHALNANTSYHGKDRRNNFNRYRGNRRHYNCNNRNNVNNQNENANVNNFRNKIPICNFCHKPGHIQKQCWHKNKNQKSNSNNVQCNLTNSKNDNNASDASFKFSMMTDLVVNSEESYLSNNVKVNNGKISGAVDSGATAHMINLPINLNNASDIKKGNVRVGVAKGNISMNAEKVGNLEVVTDQNRNIDFSNVYYIPDLRRNLFSVRQMDKAGCTVVFGNDSVKITKDGNILATGQVKDDLYVIEMQNKNVVGVANEANTNSDYVLWHRRLAHVGFSNLEKLNKLGAFGSDISQSRPNDYFCDTCPKGKQTANPHKFPPVISKSPIYRIHSDVCEITDSPIPEKYFVTFIDDYSRFVYIYVMKNKSEVLEKFKEYEALVTNQFGCGIKKFRCDNGGEYTSSEFKSFCVSKGIFIEYTAPYSCEMNGCSERMNRSLNEISRCLLIDSGLSLHWWPEALKFAVYVKNRSLSARGIIPYQAWTGKVPCYSKMRIFGCTAYVKRRNIHGKLSDRSEKCVFIGYSSNSYIFYSTNEKKLFVSNDVIFNENEMYAKCVEAKDNKNAPSDQVKNSIKADSNVGNPSRNVLSSGDQFASDKRDDIRSSSRVRRMPKKFDDYEVNLVALMSDVDAPSSYSEALCSDDSKLWHQAIQKECKNMEENGVWSVVDREPSMNVIGTRWVFNIKQGVNNETIYKARLVAKGFMQEKGIDFNETFSPVVRFEFVRTLLVLACKNGYRIDQLDVNCAFLNGDIEEDVYICVPDGVDISSDKVLKLNKSIYGLRQSAYRWNKCFTEYLKSLGFEQCKTDYCVFILRIDGRLIILILFVDDIVIIGDDDELVDMVINALKSRFKTKDLGKIRRFLGIDIEYDRDKRSISLSQCRSVLNLLKKFDMLNCRTISTPIEHKLKLQPCVDVESITFKPYKQLLGSLVYLMLGTRPDLCYAVSYFSQFQAQPTDEHFIHLKRCLRYLSYTKDYVLKYDNFNNVMLDAYSDADFANSYDRKSISGSVIRVCGNVVAWKSKKQSFVTLSSTASEYVALCDVTCSILSYISFFKELNIDVKLPICIYEDNKSCIAIANEWKNKNKCKYLDVRYAFVHEQITVYNNIYINYCETGQMMADVFTKGLPKINFVKFVKMLNLVSK